MAFEVVPISGRGRVSDAAPVRCSYHARKGGVLAITVDAGLTARLGWAPGETRLVVLEGSGADAGMVQLRPAAPGEAGGSVALSVHSRSSPGIGVLQLPVPRLRRTRVADDTSRRMVPLVHQAFGSVLTVELSPFLVTD